MHTEELLKALTATVLFPTFKVLYTVMHSNRA